jgi:hypothetical protein
MTHYQEWLIADKVVYVKFWGDVDVAEISVAFYRSNALSQESNNPPIHFLHDWSAVTSFPKKLHELYRLTKDVKGDSRLVGWVVVFGTENILMRFLGDVFFQLFKVRFKMFQNEDNAIAFLRGVDTTLPSFPNLPEIDKNSESVAT